MGSSSSALSFGVLLAVGFVLAVLVGMALNHGLTGISVQGLS